MHQPRVCFNKRETFKYLRDVNVDDVVFFCCFFFFVLRISHNKITVHWKENLKKTWSLPKCPSIILVKILNKCSGTCLRKYGYFCSKPCSGLFFAAIFEGYRLLDSQGSLFINWRATNLTSFYSILWKDYVKD